MASQITSLTIVYSTDYSDADQRKHQSVASLAFAREIHRGPVNPPHKWSVTRKIFHFMTSSYVCVLSNQGTSCERGNNDGVWRWGYRTWRLTYTSCMKEEDNRTGINKWNCGYLQNKHTTMNVTFVVWRIYNGPRQSLFMLKWCNLPNLPMPAVMVICV